MRIVGGRFRGRTLVAPRGRGTRPTSDRAREALFNVLAHRVGVAFEAARAIELFAGSGALGLEALSRGAAHVTFVDDAPAALAAIRANVAALGLEAQAEILRADARRLRSARPGEACGLAFLDPPYGKDLAAPAMDALASKSWLEDGAVVVVETAASEALNPAPDFVPVDERRLGAAMLRIFIYRP